MIFFELYPSDDWSRDTFNEVSSSLSENLLLTKLTQQQDELKQQQTDLSNRISSLTFNRHLIRTTSEATQHSTEVAIDSTREKFEDVETSIEDAADSTITEDITAYTTTGSTTHKNKNLRATDISHRQLTQNKIAALADIQIIMRGTAIRENQQTNINKSLTKQHQNNEEPRQYDDAPQEAQTTQESGITACISYEADLLSYVPLKFSAGQQRRALIDTGACANAISEKDYHELKSFGTPIATPSQVNKVRVTPGQRIPVRGQIE